MALTPEQLAQRRGKVTSSVVPAILGLHPYMSPLMAQRAITGEGTFAGNDATDRGDRLESIVLDYGGDLHGWMWRCPGTLQHPTEAWAADSTDAVYTDSEGATMALGEAKTVGLGNVDGWGQPMTDQVPQYVHVQCLWHLLFHPNVDTCLVPMLAGGHDFSFRCYRIKRRQGACDALLERMGQWHQKHIVQGDVVPAGPLDNEALARHVYPVAEAGAVLPTDAELDALCLSKLHLRDERKRLQDAEAGVEALIKQRLGTHAALGSDIVKATWKNQKDRESVDWQGLARALGASAVQIAEHTHIKPGPRVLTVSALKAPKNTPQDNTHDG